MRSVYVYLMLSALGFGAVPCPRELLRSSSSIASVINQLRWRVFWLDDGASTALVENPQFSLLFNETYVGYCARAWQVCTLYEVQKKEPLILKVDVARFDEVIAAGTWKLNTNRAGVNGKKDNHNASNHEIVIGGKVIRDPLAKDGQTRAESQLDTIALRSCVVDGGAVALGVPDSVRLRIRPSFAASLVGAIKQQGLIRFASAVVVPYFDNQDPGVLIALEKSPFGCELLMVHNLGGASWAFHPIHEIRTQSGVRDACMKIEKSAMVKLRDGRADQWIE